MENRTYSSFDTPESRFNDPFKPQGIPRGIKVLTTLSIIGCVIQFISAVINFAFAGWFYEKQKKQMEAIGSDDMPGWARSMIPDPEVAALLMQKTYDNRLPIFILSLIAVGLCFYGVFKMRKLNRQGFPYYVIGELLPFVTVALFVGLGAINEFGMYASIGVSILFIVLYAANLGKMKNEE